MNTVASLPAKLRWMIADASNLGVNERTIDLAVLEEAAAALATPAVEGASSAGEAVAWLRMTPNGEPDWAEDCIGSDDRFLDADLAADGYYLRPLTFADTTPPTPTNGVEAAIPLAEKWLSDRDMEATQEWCDGWNTCAQLSEARDTNRRLNRRVQEAEAAIPSYRKLVAEPPNGDGVRFVNGNMGRALLAHYCNQATERAEAAERDARAKQARIDELMLEYCPDEMTPEQVAEWKRHQAIATTEKADE